MRLLLTIVIFIPLMARSQQDTLKKFDSLSKYSYLLIGAIAPPENLGVRPGILILTGNATGFFIRKGKKLYLVSAFHVFTGCDVYHGVFQDLRNEFLIVPYLDTMGILRKATLPLSGFRDKPCKLFLDNPDVDVMDVSYTFKDGKINSIESMLPQKTKGKKFYDTNKYISYGFPGDRFQAYVYKTMNMDEEPNFYQGENADSSQYDPYYDRKRIDSMCLIIKPALFAGTSGSPIFKIVDSKKKRIETILFAGVQSGTNLFYNCSYIVREKQLDKILDQLK